MVEGEETVFLGRQDAQTQRTERTVPTVTLLTISDLRCSGMLRNVNW
jgi:hypothetical protein